METLAQRLETLGIALPAAAGAAARYTPAVRHGDVLYVSGQLPRTETGVAYVGKVGAALTVEQGQAAARLCAIRALAVIRDALGSVDALDAVLRMTVYVNGDESFVEPSAVADGASSLFYELLGEQRGAHARTAVVVAQLPRGAAVELDLTCSVRGKEGA